MLEINETVFIQMGNFLILLFMLNLFLFKPIRNMLQRRKGEMDALAHAIENYKTQSSQAESGLEEEKLLARKEGSKEKDDLRGTALAEEKRILTDASSQAADKLGGAREQMELNIDDVRKALEGQIAAFSKDLSEKILGRSIQ